MSALDFLQYLEKKPFQSFRIYVSDGTTYDVNHPELVMPGLTSVFVGIATDPSLPKVYGRAQHISMNHIVRLEPIQQPSEADGQG